MCLGGGQHLTPWKMHHAGEGGGGRPRPWVRGATHAPDVGQGAEFASRLRSTRAGETFEVMPLPTRTCAVLRDHDVSRLGERGELLRHIAGNPHRDAVRRATLAAVGEIPDASAPGSRSRRAQAIARLGASSAVHPRRARSRRGGTRRHRVVCRERGARPCTCTMIASGVGELGPVRLGGLGDGADERFAVDEVDGRRLNPSRAPGSVRRGSAAHRDHAIVAVEHDRAGAQLRQEGATSTSRTPHGPPTGSSAAQEARPPHLKDSSQARGRIAR
jgi:hypothetical protein